MAYEFLRGTIPDEENPARKLIDKVIELVSGCFDFPDDFVQLQIIKVCYLPN
jgi:hypothetical protein